MFNVDSTQAFAYHWSSWRLMGLHPPTSKDTFFARYYIIYSLIIHICTNICMPLSFYIECYRSETLTEFCESFYVSVLLLVQQLKLINVLRVRGHLMKLHQVLQQLDGRLQSRSEQRIIKHNARQSQRIFIWVLRLFLSVIATAVFLVLNAPNQQLAFQVWIPWDWQQSRQRFLFTLCLQNFGLLLLAIFCVGSDTYPVAYLMMVAAHWKALSIRIARMGNAAGFTNAQTHAQLINCIEDHKTLLQLLKTMEEALSFGCFIQFLCTALALCTLSFFVIYVKLSFFRLLHVLFMFASIFVETYIICYASELVTSEAEQMTCAIYACNWRNMPVQFRRILLIMLMRSQRPAGIVALGFLPVCMTTLLTVIKAAYSMFTLLNEINS